MLLRRHPHLAYQLKSATSATATVLNRHRPTLPHLACSVSSYHGKYRLYLSKVNPRFFSTDEKATKLEEEKKHKSKRFEKKNSQYGSQKGVNITKRSENYSAWYMDVIHAADMIDESPVRGCMVLKPWSIEIWDLIKTEMNTQIKNTGTKNVYFPLLMPLSFLSKEASHVEGFAKECAVVTHHRVCLNDAAARGGGKNAGGGPVLIPDETAVLSDPLVIRPTSETIIWSTFSRWIKSYKDLPLKINQWANVMRWEMRPRPFLRNSEFLWQEGHTAHSTSEEAVAMTRQMLAIYQEFCQNFLAMPVIPGVKSESEKFAGAESTYTIEGLMQNGWALQCGTSHFLGTNFGRAFDVSYQSSSGEVLPVWATSWGVSTRLIGGVIMTHSDDTGLVLPPLVAPVQVVLVPLISPTAELSESTAILNYITDFGKELKALGIRYEIDSRDSNTIRPGAKYYEWERKGVPVRIVLGPNELRNNSINVKSRIAVNDKKENVGVLVPKEDAVRYVQKQLEQVQLALFSRASQRLSSCTSYVASYQQLVKMLKECSSSHNNGEEDIGDEDEGEHNSSWGSNEFRKDFNIHKDNENIEDVDEKRSRLGFYLVPWFPDIENEKRIKSESKLTIRCYPDAQNFDDGAIWQKYKEVYNQVKDKKTVCFFSGNIATELALFARNF